MHSVVLNAHCIHPLRNSNNNNNKKLFAASSKCPIAVSKIKREFFPKLHLYRDTLSTRHLLFQDPYCMRWLSDKWLKMVWSNSCWIFVLLGVLQMLFVGYNIIKPHCAKGFPVFFKQRGITMYGQNHHCIREQSLAHRRKQRWPRT